MIGKLESIHYVYIPEDFTFSSALKLDKSIPLPIQEKDGSSPGSFDLRQLTEEQILSGILVVLAYDKENKNFSYYRALIIRLRPNIVKELGAAAVLKSKNEDWEAANELFLILNLLDEKNVRAKLNTALFFDLWATSCHNLQQYEKEEELNDKAASYYNIVVNTEPPLPDAFFNLGFFYLKQHKIAAAQDALETYLALTCDLTDEEAGEEGLYKKERATSILNRLVKGKEAQEEYSKCYTLISKGKVTEGLKAVHSFLTLYPKVANAWFLLGWGLRQERRYSEAKEAFKKALSLGEEGEEIYNEMAICLIEGGEKEEAMKMLKKAFSLSPKNTKILSNIAFLYEKMGRIKEAVSYFNIVLEYNKDDAIAREELKRLTPILQEEREGE